MKHTVVPAAVLSFWMLSGCGGQKHDPAAQAPPPVRSRVKEALASSPWIVPDVFL